MNTQCPHCRTMFRIERDQLEAAGGRVRCSHCRRVFDARARLQTELPLDAGSGPERDHRRGGGGQAELELAGGRSGGVAGVLLSDLAAEPAPASGAGRGSLWLWAGVNAVLVLALCAQLLFAQRAAFAQDPTLRPVLARMCDVVGCTLAPRRSVERIELVRRNVYAHPNVDDALIIDATFVNNARFAQPYPLLTISLGDIRGEPVVRRNFRPREYLPGLDPNARMAPGSPVRVSLEVRDPGREVRTFEIDFG